MRFHVALAVVTFVSSLSLQLAPSKAHAVIEQIGIAEFSSLRRSFYLAGISAENAAASEQELLTTGGQEKRLDIKVVADTYSQRRFSQQWSQSLIVSASQDQLLAFDDALVHFQNMLDEPFQQGDTISVEANDRGISTVYLNGIEVFDVNKPGFLELLLSTWIGDKPPSTQFKQTILEGSAPDALKQQFASLQPDTQRIESIKSALTETTESETNDKPVLVASEQELITAAQEQAKPKPVAKAAPSVIIEPQVVKQPAATIATVEEPKVTAEPVVAAIEEAEPEIDPEIYRAQQDTLEMLYATSASRSIKSNLSYPKRALKMEQQGVVKVEVAVDRSGQISSMRMVKETKYKLLNNAAIAAIEEAGKLKAIPAAIDADYITFVIPFQFLLQ